MGDPEPTHRIRADCVVCGRSHLARIRKARVAPDPVTRAEAVGNAPEDWIDAPPWTEFDASCPECGSVTPHKMPDRSPFPGGFSVPTTEANESAGGMGEARSAGRVAPSAIAATQKGKRPIWNSDRPGGPLTVERALALSRTREQPSLLAAFCDRRIRGTTIDSSR